MKASDIVSTKTLKATYSEAGSNKIPYLGAGFFPTIKKMGIDIKQIRTAKGLPITLAPSAFDTVSTIRSKEGFKIDETEMAFFKESVLVKERDRIELARVQDANDGYAIDVYKNIYNDFAGLMDSAEVVAERMRMQLLASDGGHPSISISGDGATYTYNYDPNSEYSAHNYKALEGTSVWSDTTHSTPIADIKSAKKALRSQYGTEADVVIISDATMDYLMANTSVRNAILAQNVSANVVVDEDAVKEVFKRKAKVTLVVYEKMFKDESGNATNFYPDGFATLVPNGALGNTYYGATPDELAKSQGEDIDTELFDGKISVTVTNSTDPVQTKTTVSEVLLPSFERMLETYTIKAWTPSAE